MILTFVIAKNVLGGSMFYVKTEDRIPVFTLNKLEAKSYYTKQAAERDAQQIDNSFLEELWFFSMPNKDVMIEWAKHLD